MSVRLDLEWLNILAKQPSFKRYERGSALAISLMIGSVMTIVGLTMVARTRTGSIAALSQANQVRSLAAMEGGIARTLAKLNARHYTQLLTQNFEDWTNPDYIPYCLDEDEFTAEVVSGDIGAGGQSYRVVDYQYDAATEQGTLTVAGDAGLSSSQVAQTVAIRGDGDDTTANFPALIGILDINLGGNDVLGVDANVVCSDRTQCVVACSGPGGSFAGEPDLRSAVGANNNSVIGGDIFVGPVELPDVPQLPPGLTAIDLGDIDLNSGSTRINGHTVSGVGNQYVLPRSGDRASVGLVTGDTIYYEVDDIDIQGTRELAIDTSEGPIYVYLTGDIDIGGNAAIVHTSPTNQSADFRIYGADTDGTPPTIEQEISLSGNSCMDAFIFAPNAIMGIKGGGTCGANVNGAVWVKRWTNSAPVGSNSTSANITVPADMPSQLGDLQVDVEYSSGATTGWQMEAANPTTTDNSTTTDNPTADDSIPIGGECERDDVDVVVGGDDIDVVVTVCESD